ncbi:MAG: hypothetical protein Q7S05_00170 [bacterium]|nr:hypothetical protein [bacterium]
MSNIKIVPLVLGALVALSGVAFAQESATVPANMAPKNARAILEDLRAKKTGVKAEIQDVRKDIRKESVELRQDTKEKMGAATTSAERRAIEKNAIEERKEIISERKAGIVEIRDQKKDLIETRKASSTEIKDQRKEQARRHLELIAHRYGVAIKQFENLAGRIQSRIDKIKSAGADTAAAESALTTAVSAIAQVKTDVQALRDLLSQAETVTDLKTIRTQVEAATKKANESVKSAHKALQVAAKTLATLAKPEKSSLNASRGEASGERSVTQNVVAATSTKSDN